jgi:hypothetical protein
VVGPYFVYPRVRLGNEQRFVADEDWCHGRAFFLVRRLDLKEVESNVTAGTDETGRLEVASARVELKA